MRQFGRRVAVFAAVLFVFSGKLVLAEAWRFGIIPDTQWSPSDGRVAKGVPVEIIADVNRQFIKSQVRFVVAVGDICQNAKTGAVDELDIRAAANKELVESGVRFFPVRGNHDGTTPAAADRFNVVFPGMPGSGVFDASGGFSDEGSPAVAGLAGKSYAFTYRNATFVLVDTFVVNDGTANGSVQPLDVQLPWITSKLAAAKAAGRHAFFVSHKNLLGQQHKDNIFGTPRGPDDPGDADPAKRETQSAFFRTLADNNVRLYFSGHDHMYFRSLVRSPDGSDTLLQQVITGSCSYKFYEPAKPYSANEMPLVQQRNAVGYIIVTVDGPAVKVEYYSAAVNTQPGKDRTVISHWSTPDHWDLADTFGYSQNGRQFLIGPGKALTSVADQSNASGGLLGTKMAILSGTYDTDATTLDDRAQDRRRMWAQVTTGWSPSACPAAASDMLSLWGLRTHLNSPTTPTYVLSLKASRRQDTAAMAICSPDAAGKWVPAASGNSHGRASRVDGPWKSEYCLGSYGYDAGNDIFWAVVDHEGDFVIAPPQP